MCMNGTSCIYRKSLEAANPKRETPIYYLAKVLANCRKMIKQMSIIFFLQKFVLISMSKNFKLSYYEFFFSKCCVILNSTYFP